MHAANSSLLDLVVNLTDPTGRSDAARLLARRLGADDLIIFVVDAEVEALLPAPGFPQTLSQGRDWRLFLTDCKDKGSASGKLAWLKAADPSAVLGYAASDGSVIVLVGGTPRSDSAELDEVCDLLPLLAAAFRGEKAAQIAESNAAAARQAAAQTRHLAQTLDHARRELQQALRVRDQFLTIAAHELRTPLTSLLGYCQVMTRRTRREGTLNERDQAALDTIYTQAQRLHRMINDLFDLVRLQSNAVVIKREPVDLSQVCRRLVDELSAGIESHTVTLETEAPLMVMGDEQRLEHVLENLLSNAIKYSPNGGAIDVSAIRRNGDACISVSDHGIGIPAEARERLFTRYYRAGNVNPSNISGLGIGLYLVNQIVASHGGTVDFQSEIHKGSTFTVCIPLLQEEPVSSSEPTG